MTPYELLLIFRSKLTGELVLVEFQSHYDWYRTDDYPYCWYRSKKPLPDSRRDYADLEMYGWGTWSVPPSSDITPEENFIQYSPVHKVGVDNP